MKHSKPLTQRVQLSLIGLGLTLGFAPWFTPLTGGRLVLAEMVDVTLLQVNDVYEITPVEGGRWGGMARLATLRQRLRSRNHRTFTLLAGDALSPSALGTARVGDRRLAGQQMVAVMNAVGFDFATFGNHEFDLTEEDFLLRLQESKFRWFSSNVEATNGQPFPSVERSQILTVQGDAGSTVRVGLMGLTIDSNPASYVRYRHPIETAKQEVAALRGKVDVIVAVTHLSLAEDQRLATAVPEIDLILGGHEHENIQLWRLGQPADPAYGARSPLCPYRGTPIFKADANARTAYVHTLRFNTVSRCLWIDSYLQPITAALPEEPKTARVVQEWLEKGFRAFRANGFEPTQIVGAISETLDGLEESVRNRPTNLTQLIAKAMLQEVGKADLAIFNGGSIRIDDRIPAGPISQYDIIRMLPFGGKVLAVEIPGELLQRVLEQGRANRGTGGYLQTANVEYDGAGAGRWSIRGEALQPQRLYTVAVNDFLMSGKEQNLAFLSLAAPGVKLLAEKRDIRLAVIEALRAER